LCHQQGSLYRETTSYATYCEGVKNSNERKKESRKEAMKVNIKRNKKTKVLTAYDGAQKFVPVDVTTSYGGAEV
jgi:hypothetical protein